jgi:hypothetical protein
MGNEHIPPVLLLMSFLGGAFYLFKNRKLPNLRFIILPISIFIGYLFLFFAPANSVKEKVVGKSTFDIGFNEYISQISQILKTYFYYNTELIIAGLLIIFAVFIFKNKLKISIFTKKEFGFYICFAVLPLLIVGISPLIGTRLLFFSTAIIVILLYKLLLILQDYFRFKFFNLLSYAFLIAFFIFSVWITFHANENYNFIVSEIKNEKLKSDDVILKHEFNYFDDRFGNSLNKKILLESGEDYINEDASDNKSMELNLINYYHLNSLKEKK